MILVTGAAGFIGSHLCERLLEQDFTVVGVDNFDPFYDPEIKKKNLRHFKSNPAFYFHEATITDISMLEKIFSQHEFSHIVHLAAKAGVRPSIEQPIAYKTTNIDGTLNLLEMARLHGINRFIFASSSSVYGNNKKTPFSETDPVDNPISPYAATKKAGELLCYTYHHLYQIHISALRFFTVYGPRQRPEMAIHKFTRRIDSGEPVQLYGHGKLKRDFTYIEDILQGMMSAIESVQGYEIFNLGESQTFSTSQLIDVIEQKLGKKAIREETEMQPGDVDITYADISKAKKLLSYKPTITIEEGITRFVKWYVAQKELLEKVET
jgi:UDP-glucuronate 4-epimerase